MVFEDEFVVLPVSIFIKICMAPRSRCDVYVNFGYDEEAAEIAAAGAESSTVEGKWNLDKKKANAEEVPNISEATRAVVFDFGSK